MIKKVDMIQILNGRTSSYEVIDGDTTVSYKWENKISGHTYKAIITTDGRNVNAVIMKPLGLFKKSSSSDKILRYINRLMEENVGLQMFYSHHTIVMRLTILSGVDASQLFSTVTYNMQNMHHLLLDLDVEKARFGEIPKGG